jgi:hypothetical protein
MMMEKEVHDDLSIRKKRGKDGEREREEKRKNNTRHPYSINKYSLATKYSTVEVVPLFFNTPTPLNPAEAEETNTFPDLPSTTTFLPFKAGTKGVVAPD